jgi:uncharacterized membrane protein YfcA
MNWTTFQVLAVLFFATLVRSVFGFGEALVAVPLLALVMPVEVAAPVAALVSITVAGIVVAQDGDKIHLRSAGWLVVSSLFGIPFGLVLLKTVSEPVVKTILAVVIIAFSVYSLMRRSIPALKDDRLAWLFGFSAGILGGAYGMNGPPLVVYGALRRWSPQHFRATLQGYFLPASTMVMCGYWLTGLWTRTVSGYYLLALAPVIAAAFLGRIIHRHLPSDRFRVYVYVVLAMVGAVLLLQAFSVTRTRDASPVGRHRTRKYPFQTIESWKQPSIPVSSSPGFLKPG